LNLLFYGLFSNYQQNELMLGSYMDREEREVYGILRVFEEICLLGGGFKLADKNNFRALHSLLFRTFVEGSVVI
jgi:hypothetical protein